MDDSLCRSCKHKECCDNEVVFAFNLRTCVNRLSNNRKIGYVLFGGSMYSFDIEMAK